MTRYILTRDNDLHWYVIPADKAEDWEQWLSLDSEHWRAFEVPDYAERVNGAPSRVTFLDPVIAE